jgi:hypothetical protein
MDRFSSEISNKYTSLPCRRDIMTPVIKSKKSAERLRDLKFIHVRPLFRMAQCLSRSINYFNTTINHITNPLYLKLAFSVKDGFTSASSAKNPIEYSGFLSQVKLQTVTGINVRETNNINEINDDIKINDINRLNRYSIYINKSKEISKLYSINNSIKYSDVIDNHITISGYLKFARLKESVNRFRESTWLSKTVSDPKQLPAPQHLPDHLHSSISKYRSDEQYGSDKPDTSKSDSAEGIFEKILINPVQFSLARYLIDFSIDHLPDYLCTSSLRSSIPSIFPGHYVDRQHMADKHYGFDKRYGSDKPNTTKSDISGNITLRKMQATSIDADKMVSLIPLNKGVAGVKGRFSEAKGMTHDETTYQKHRTAYQHETIYGRPPAIEHIAPVRTEASGTRVIEKITHAPDAPWHTAFDLSRLTDQVYSLMERKIKIERERRGLYA